MQMDLSASLEDYLEAVFVLDRERRVARVRDIARHMRVKKSSVGAALKRLSEAGLVTHEPYEFVRLTPAGEKVARRIHHRHETLRRFLQEVLNLPDEIAREDACRMEHGLHPQTVDQLQRFLEFLESRGGESAPCVKALRKSIAKNHTRRGSVKCTEEG